MTSGNNANHNGTETTMTANDLKPRTEINDNCAREINLSSAIVRHMEIARMAERFDKVFVRWTHGDGTVGTASPYVTDGANQIVCASQCGATITHVEYIGEETTFVREADLVICPDVVAGAYAWAAARSDAK